MKNYTINLFVQDNCPPCERVKAHLETLTEAERKEIHLVPMKTPSGELTRDAVDAGVDLTPTLLVSSVELSCALDSTGEEYCDQYEESVERVIGGDHIIKRLYSILDAYTYAHMPIAGATW